LTRVDLACLGRPAREKGAEDEDIGWDFPIPGYHHIACGTSENRRDAGEVAESREEEECGPFTRDWQARARGIEASRQSQWVRADAGGVGTPRCGIGDAAKIRASLASGRRRTDFGGRGVCWCSFSTRIVFRGSVVPPPAERTAAAVVACSSQAGAHAHTGERTVLQALALIPVGATEWKLWSERGGRKPLE